MTDVTKSTRSTRWWTLGVVAVAGVVLDQVTKAIAEAQLKAAGRIELIEGYFELRYSKNTGAFFSLGASLSPIVRRSFFITSTVLAIGLMLYLYKQALDTQRALRWALTLLITGAIGNLIDRARYGEVMDFLHFHIRDVFHWATFNVADICITCGLCLLFVDMFGTKRQDGVEGVQNPTSSRPGPR